MVKSLRWRIQIWHGAILAVVIILFGTLTYVQQRQSRTNTIHNELRAATEVLTGQLKTASPSALDAMLAGSDRDGRSPHRLDSSSAAMRLLGDLKVPQTFGSRQYRHEFEHPYFIIWDASGNVVKASTSAPNIMSPVSSFSTFETKDGATFRQRYDFMEHIAEGPQRTIVLAGRNVHADFKDLRNLAYLLVSSGAAVFALGLLGGWFLSGRSVRPLEAITRIASDITEKNLSDRIDIGQTDSELANLAQTLNETFSRLQTAFERQVQFTADASHELRTPLSVVQMHQELALSKERTPEEYREAIETCQRATTRMNSLVESLLTLARLDAADVPQRQPVDLGTLVTECTQQLKPLSSDKNIHVVVQATIVFVKADRDQLAQVITNLLTNAIAYSPSETEVTAVVQSVDGKAVLSVADQGPGIPEKDVAHIFERFYRVDKQRNCNSGGSGLGLAICKTIVQTHRGTISVRSRTGEGSTFVVTLPESG